MTFVRSQLCALVYADGFTLWHYRTGDGLKSVETPGYFDNALDSLREGDVLIMNIRHEMAIRVVQSIWEKTVRIGRPI